MKTQEKKLKILLTRYLLLSIIVFLLVSSFISFLFLEFYNIVFKVILPFLTPVVFFGGAFEIIDKNYYFIIVRECIGISAYVLFATIFFSLPLRLKTIGKLFVISALLFTFFNIIRIAFLMWIHIEFGIYYFEKVHLVFYELVTAVVSSGIIIVLLKKEKVKKLFPVASDVKYVLKEFRKKS